MTVNDILLPVINEELEKYESGGKNIKLKTAGKRRIKYTIICGLIVVLGFWNPLCYIAIPVYIILMVKTKNKSNVILSLARKSPNKPIDQIIAEEIKA